MSADPHGCGNDTQLPLCCKLHTRHLLQLRGFYYSDPASSLPPCLDEKSSGPLAVIIIPCLLALSTVLVVALIFYSLRKNKERVQSATPHFTNGINCLLFMNPTNNQKALSHPSLGTIPGADSSLVAFSQADRSQPWLQLVQTLQRSRLPCIPGKSLKSVFLKGWSFGSPVIMAPFVKVCWARVMEPPLLWWWSPSKVQQESVWRTG